MEPDHSLRLLLDLDGTRFVVDTRGYWVKFDIREVPASSARPHGLAYSLTLHDPAGKRVLGYDNAHSIPKTPGRGGERTITLDHRHRHRVIRSYRYSDAATLLTDFWTAVEGILKGEE